ncbi:MAG: hypothetical protein FJZ59_07135 [Chlamydiae bacterium]|nr:hypothetical protein [Chlamydiota bacterium]
MPSLPYNFLYTSTHMTYSIFMQFFCYHNGTFVLQNSFGIPSSLLGFTRGYAAFELIRTYDFTPFYLQEHLKRLENSAKTFLLEFPSHLEEIIDRLIKKNNHPNVVIRIYLSEDESGKSHVILFSEPIVFPDKKFYEKGMPVVTTSYTRTFPLVKSTCYLSAIIALKEAALQNAEDALFTNGEGHLLEFTKSNFFAVVQGTLYTPKEGVLFGITRAIVIELAKQLCLDVKEDVIHKKDLPFIEEAFSTSTIREILPISKIDQTEIRLGPITKKLQSAFLTLKSNLKIDCLL